MQGILHHLIVLSGNFVHCLYFIIVLGIADELKVLLVTVHIKALIFGDEIELAMTVGRDVKLFDEFEILLRVLI